MDWRFIDNNTIEEFSTGYVIKLLAGTWLDPREIKPVASGELSFVRQAELLRCGMEYVTGLWREQK